LPDSCIIFVPANVTKYVGCQEDVVRDQLFARLGEKGGDGFRTRFVRSRLGKLDAFGIREANVIKLDFIESGFGRIDG
jgi:hypothetical protein